MKSLQTPDEINPVIKDKDGNPDFSICWICKEPNTFENMEPCMNCLIKSWNQPKVVKP